MLKDKEFLDEYRDECLTGAGNSLLDALSALDDASVALRKCVHFLGLAGRAWTVDVARTDRCGSGGFKFPASSREQCVDRGLVLMGEAVAALESAGRLLGDASGWVGEGFRGVGSERCSGGSGSSSLAGDGFSPALDPAEEDSIGGGAA